MNPYQVAMQTDVNKNPETGPSFADFKFTTIGQAPGLLSRLSDPTSQEVPQDEERTPSPAPSATPDPALQYPSRGITPRNNLARPTLFQSLSGEALTQEALLRIKEEAFTQPFLRSPSSGNPFEFPISLAAPSPEVAPTANQTVAAQMGTSQSAPSAANGISSQDTSISSEQSRPRSPLVVSTPFQFSYTSSAAEPSIPGCDRMPDASSSSAPAYIQSARDFQARMVQALSSLRVHDLSQPLLSIQQSVNYAEKALKEAQSSEFKVQQCRALLDQLHTTAKDAISAAENAKTHAEQAAKAIKELTDVAGSEPWRQQSLITSVQDDLRAFSELIADMAKADSLERQRLAKEQEEREKLQDELSAVRMQLNQTPQQNRRASPGIPSTHIAPKPISLERLSPQSETSYFSTKSTSSSLVHSADFTKGTVSSTHTADEIEMVDPSAMPVVHVAPNPKSSPPTVEKAHIMARTKSATRPSLPVSDQQSAGSRPSTQRRVSNSATWDSTVHGLPSSDVAKTPDSSAAAHDQHPPESQELAASGRAHNDIAMAPPSPPHFLQRSAALGIRPHSLSNTSLPNSTQFFTEKKLSQVASQHVGNVARLQSVPPIAVFSSDSPQSPEERSPLYEHSRSQELGNVPIIPDPIPVSPPAQIREANLRHIREIQSKSPPKSSVRKSPSVISVKKEEPISPLLSVGPTSSTVQSRNPFSGTPITPSPADKPLIPQSQQTSVAQPASTPLPSRRLLSNKASMTPSRSPGAQGASVAPQGPRSEATDPVKQLNGPPSISNLNATASPLDTNGPAQGAAKDATGAVPVKSKIADRSDISNSNASDHSTPPPTISLSSSPNTTPPPNSIGPSASANPLNPASAASERRVADTRAQTQLPGRPRSPVTTHPQTSTLGKRKQQFDDHQEGNRGRPRVNEKQPPTRKALGPRPHQQPPLGLKQHQLPLARRPSPPSQHHRAPSPMERSRSPLAMPSSSGGSLRARIGAQHNPDSDGHGGQSYRPQYDYDPPSPPSHRRLVYERPENHTSLAQQMGPPANNHLGRGRGANRARGHPNNYRGRGGAQPTHGGVAHHFQQQQQANRSSLEARLSSPPRSSVQNQHPPTVPLAARLSSDPNQHGYTGFF